MNKQFKQLRALVMDKKQAQLLWNKVVTELPSGYHLSELTERKTIIDDSIYKAYYFGVYSDTGTKALFTIQCPEDWKEIKEFCGAMSDKLEEDIQESLNAYGDSSPVSWNDK